MEHPSQRRHRFSSCNDLSLPHQHRLHRRPKRHPLPHHCQSADILHDHHFLRPAKAHPRPAAPTPSMVARSLRRPCQRARPLLPSPHLRLQFFPSRHTRHSSHDELVHCHVCWNDSVFNFLLCYYRSTQLYATSYAGAQRYLGVLEDGCNAIYLTRHFTCEMACS